MRMKMATSATRLPLGASTHSLLPAIYSRRSFILDPANRLYSTNSIDELLNGDTPDPITDAWRVDLADRIQELIDRKRSSVQGREKCLATYIRTLTAQYAEEDIRGKEAELVIAFLRSIKAESSERETILAMKGWWSIRKVYVSNFG